MLYGPSEKIDQMEFGFLCLFGLGSGSELVFRTVLNKVLNTSLHCRPPASALTGSKDARVAIMSMLSVHLHSKVLHH